MPENKEIIRQAYIDTLKDLLTRWQDLQRRYYPSWAIDDDGNLIFIHGNTDVFELNNAINAFNDKYIEFQEWRRANESLRMQGK